MDGGVAGVAVVDAEASGATSGWPAAPAGYLLLATHILRREKPVAQRVTTTTA